MKRNIHIFSLSRYYNGAWFWFMGFSVLFFGTLFFYLMIHPSLKYYNSILWEMGGCTLISLLFFLVPSLTIPTYLLCKKGRMEKARITGMKMNTGFRSTPSYVWVSYHYQGMNGNMLSGKSRTGAEDLSIMDEKKVGDAIPILVSQTDETKSCMIPRLKRYKDYWDTAGMSRCIPPYQKRITTNRSLLLFPSTVCFAGALLAAISYGNSVGGRDMRSVLEASSYLLFFISIALVVLLLRSKPK